MPQHLPPRLSRRAALALLGVGVVGLVSRDGARVLALAGPPGTEPAGLETRAALAATAGPPQIPSAVRLRLTSGAECTIDMEEYVKGVVPAEVPASWPLETLKAQAVAARTYAATYVATYGYVCATSACQNWNPTLRTAQSDAAVEATRGELMTYQGGMIWSYYSSTCGGQTATSPDAAALYCQSVMCWRNQDGSGRTAPDRSSETAAASFWRDTPVSSLSAFCKPASYLRFTWSVSRTDMETILDQNLAAAGATGYRSGDLGTLRDLSITTPRAYSGKATTLHVVGATKSWDINRYETDIRSLLRRSPTASPQYSANDILALARDASGNITQIGGAGGGFGHGIGLCQWGAKGMADAGYDYHTILQHYYSSIAFATVGPSGSSVPSPGARRFYLPVGAKGSSACS